MLRLLPRLQADGPTQMATDEALLESARSPCLRLYSWLPATVSLGYFQDFAAISAALQVIPGQVPPVVRRITGGGAIWHEHEVTYSLVAELGHGGVPRLVRDIYPLVHGAVMAGLRARGALVQRQDRPQGDRRYASEPRCFASPATDDVVTLSGAKVLGSAARTRGPRVLVHGSLKLASNVWDQDRASGCGLDFAEAATVIEEAITRAIGQPLEAGDFAAEELTVRDRIQDARYGSPDWVRLRRGQRP